MKGYALQSASLRWQGDPELQLGRRVRMTDKRGQVTLTHVTRQTLTFDRGFSMVTECALRASSGASALISPSGSIRGSAITGSIHGNLIIDGSLGVTALAARSITADYIAASAIDTMNLSVIVGTLAGDDTVMVVMRDNNAAAQFCGEISNLTK